ncbi:hypothetical protein HDE_04911 [Halotydeus destructor]|nr:hypothetical protein HDE_04911 [Halotydeus destructor]
MVLFYFFTLLAICCQARGQNLDQLSRAIDLDLTDWSATIVDSHVVSDMSVKIVTYDVIDNSDVVLIGAKLVNWTFRDYVSTMSKNDEMAIVGHDGQFTVNLIAYPDFQVESFVSFLGEKIDVLFDGIVTVLFDITFKYDAIEDKLEYVADEHHVTYLGLHLRLTDGGKFYGHVHEAMLKVTTSKFKESFQEQFTKLRNYYFADIDNHFNETKKVLRRQAAQISLD